MSSEEDNELRIETDSIDVTLRGSAEEVSRAYDALRSLLVDSFESTLASEESERREDSERLAAGTTDPLHRRPEDPESPPPSYSAAVRTLVPELPPDREAGIVQLILRRESHAKVHLLDRPDVADSFLGRSLETAILRRIYADGSIEHQLDEALDLGTTVWRELTPEGRIRVEREVEQLHDSGVSEESEDA